MIVDFVTKLRDLVRLSPKVKQFFLTIFFVALLFEVVKFLPPYIFKVLIDRLVTYDPAIGLTFDVVWPILVGYGASLFFMTMIEVIFARFGERLIRTAEVDLTSKTLEKLLSLDVRYHELNNTGETVSKLIKGAIKVAELFYHCMWALFPIMIQAALTLIVLFYFGWQIGLVLLLFIPIFLTVLFRGAMLTQKARDKYHKHYDLFAGSVSQSVTNIRTVKDFDNEKFEIKKAKRDLNAYVKALYDRVRTGLRNRILEDGLISLGRVLTLVFAVVLMLEGRMTAGSLVLVVTISEKAFINLGRLYRVYYQIQDIEPAVERFKSVYREEIQVKDSRSKKKITKGSVEFENVSFRYNKNDRDALKNVNIQIPARSTMALVGKSGSGKTTLVKLLLRHFDVQSGAIKIGGKPIQDYSLAELRKNISVVSQDVELFNDTIMGNISYGKLGASKKEVIKAAKMAYAHDFIMEFDKGYDSIIGERGVKLSGGQKQRLAIARALLCNPKILVFDEATSALDAESEKYIHDAIFGLIGKITLVIIAHRFSTIQHADTIVLLDKGRVKETGTHQELIKEKGIFAQLRKLQELGDVE